MKCTLWLASTLVLLLTASLSARAASMSTSFSYQGRLLEGSSPANGSYDITFRLFDAPSGGVMVGPTQNLPSVLASSGLFNVTLDFGVSAFEGDARWLEIAVRPAGSTAPQTVLAPRQAVLASPYALHALTADGVAGDLAIPSMSSINFGNNVRQMLNLWGTQYGIGVQADTLYNRSHNGFAWYKDGIHSNATFEPGAGGRSLMTLSSNGSLEINHTTPGFGLLINSGIGHAARFNAQASIRMDSSMDRAHLRLEETQENDFARLEFQSASKPVWHIAVGGSDNQMNFYNKANGDVMALTQDGNLWVKVVTITGGADLAEPFPMADRTIEKGAVVVIDEEHPGQLRRSDRAYDTRVAGIVSGANGIRPGLMLSQHGTLDEGQQVALSGRVYVQADATRSPIRPGDLLTTSETPGHAMKVTDHARAQGAILGKAMSSLPEGTGLVLVLVTLQ